ncbi:hypothetical protein [Pseudomonas sp. RT6P73]
MVINSQYLENDFITDHHGFTCGARQYQHGYFSLKRSVAILHETVSVLVNRRLLDHQTWQAPVAPFAPRTDRRGTWAKRDGASRAPSEKTLLLSHQRL